MFHLELNIFAAMWWQCVQSVDLSLLLVCWIHLKYVKWCAAGLNKLTQNWLIKNVQKHQIYSLPSSIRPWVVKHSFESWAMSCTWCGQWLRFRIYWNDIYNSAWLRRHKTPFTWIYSNKMFGTIKEMRCFKQQHKMHEIQINGTCWNDIWVCSTANSVCIRAYRRNEWAATARWLPLNASIRWVLIE